MSRTGLFALLGISVLLAGGVLWLSDNSRISSERISTPKLVTTESAALCPWREPDNDLKLFFPEATRRAAEKRVFTAVRRDAEKRLGRPPSPDEMILELHKVFHGEELVGTILIRRVKGEYGVIEMVLAVARSGEIAGVRFQRIREPETTLRVLTDPKWLGAFTGKTVASPCRLGEDIPAVSPDVEKSARAVVEGIHALLILLDMSTQPNVHRVEH